MAAAAHVSSAQPAVQAASRITGVVLDVRDLTATRSFYEPVFQQAPGRWEDSSRGLAFHTDSQRIEFVPRAHPRTLAEHGQHTAYRVPASRLSAIADALRAAGASVNWWREDHPTEREMRPYLQDPSGNLFQLVPADPPRPLIDHVMLAVHELNLAEKLHLEILGGELDYYHAWRTTDQWEARAWAEGDDPCAPWTRAQRYNNFYHVVTPRPTPQVYARYGDTRLGMVVASKHVQEPPEEVLKGTPRVILQGASSARELASYLATVDPAARQGPPKRGIRFRQDGQRLYLRDRSGNFLQIDCGA